jgi:argininosuccinate lyase
MIRKRLGKDMEEEAALYTSSLEFDRNIVSYDILGSLAHTVMLAENKIVSRDDASKILKALKEMLEGVEELEFDPEVEDIHMAIEGLLVEKIGEVGGKLHTARSRNDQIACDLRMWVRGEVNDASRLIISLLGTLLELANRHVETMMPGYTHLQHAQPTTLAHHLMAHCDAFMRDLKRLENAYERINLNPLGSCALATTSFPIDRARTAELLGFDGLLENSMDAVSSRDYILETLSCLAILMADVSRLAEELILWSTHEFGFIELSDEYASTSSIMPQKKNPDVLEVMRARASRAFGDMISGFVMLKSLPYSYNRDLQELSPILLDSFNISKDSLRLLNKVLKTSKINKERMSKACEETFITATELADLLVREKGMPFRTAHGIVARVVAEALRQGRGPGEIDSKFIERAHGKPLALSDKKIKKALSVKEAVKIKTAAGGPSPGEVERMARSREKLLSKRERLLKDRERRIEESRGLLFKAMEELMEG